MKKLSILFFLVAPLFLSAQTKPRSKNQVKTAGITSAIAKGHEVYTTYCLTCHQADGGGVPNMNPPLIKTSYVTGDKVKLIKVVLNGFMENIDIDGESYSNTMPPHGFLKDREIADVLTYIRNKFTNKGSAITAAQVKAVRAANKKSI